MATVQATGRMLYIQAKQNGDTTDTEKAPEISKPSPRTAPNPCCCDDLCAKINLLCCGSPIVDEEELAAFQQFSTTEAGFTNIDKYLTKDWKTSVGLQPCLDFINNVAKCETMIRAIKDNGGRQRCETQLRIWKQKVEHLRPEPLSPGREGLRRNRFQNVIRAHSMPVAAARAPAPPTAHASESRRRPPNISIPE